MLSFYIKKSMGTGGSGRTDFESRIPAPKGRVAQKGSVAFLGLWPTT
jgi:hypothetical protein